MTTDTHIHETTGQAEPSTWEDALTRLESDVAAARTLLASEKGGEAPAPEAYEAYLDQVTTWTPPTTLGPLPEVLMPRALGVLASQHQVADALSRALAANTRQRGFTAKVTGATSTAARPAYLDITA